MAVVVAVAVLSMSSSASLLHVHASPGHAHEAHHHGPAAHSHAPVAHRDHHGAAHGGGAEIEACDSADHVVPLAFTGVAVEPGDGPLPDTFDSRVLATSGTSAAAVAPSDVRAHSPPRLTDAPLRAPPIPHLA